MLTRSLDEIIHATRFLPDHLIAAWRYYSQNPAAIAAFRRLQDALMEVDSALLGRRALPPATGAEISA